MKRLMTLMALAGLLSVGLVVRAEEKKDEAKKEEAKKDAYPLKTCIVTGDELGEMGEPIKYLYKDAQGNSREIRFCCKNCIKKFERNPARYLKVMDDAVAKAAKTPAAEPAKPAEEKK
jgi:hypothetical protein